MVLADTRRLVTDIRPVPGRAGTRVAWRCARCGHQLAKVDLRAGSIETVCRRCGAYNVLSAVEAIDSVPSACNTVAVASE